MSQRTIERKERITGLRRNLNGRIPAVLTLFGIMLGIMSIMEFFDVLIATPVPLIIMIMLLNTIDESIFHSEVKSVRQNLLLLLLFEVIRAGFFSSNLNIYAPIFDFPILLTWGVLFIQTGGMFRRNSFLIWNEVLENLIVIVNWIAGILFYNVFFWEIGAFLGLVPPIPLVNTITLFSACMTGIGIAISCSFSNRVFLKQLKMVTQVKKRVNNNK